MNNNINYLILIVFVIIIFIFIVIYYYKDKDNSSLSNNKIVKYNLPDYEIIENKSTDIKYIIFNINDTISNSVRITGGFSDNIQQYAISLIKDKNKNILDIGANLGTFTIPIAKYINSGMVYSFEVQKIIFIQLCSNIFLNKLTNVYPIHGLVCDKIINKFSNIILPDYKNNNNLGGYTVLDQKSDINSIEEKVRNIVIDDLNINNIGLIKIDIEGSEIYALKGMENTLKNNNYPPIIFECWNADFFKDKKIELFEYITNKLNYNITLINNADYVAIKNK